MRGYDSVDVATYWYADLYLIRPDYTAVMYWGTDRRPSSPDRADRNVLGSGP
jgi:hypothetical protein